MLVRLFVLFGSLLVLALCAALIGPYFIDWTSYRADFEREASAILGRKVEVRGEASARILPFPSVSFSDVVVSGNRDTPVMTAESFSMDAELAPFLSGDILIFDMRLVRPRADLTADENGVVDWAIAPSTPVDPGHISIENLSIVEGQMLLRDSSTGRQLELNEINTDISARSLKGPWRAVGSLRVNGRRTTLTATTGVTDGSGQTSLSLSAQPEVFPVKVDSEGQIINDKGVLRYEGRFRAVGVAPVQAELRDGEGRTARPEAQVARNRANGDFRLSGGRLDIGSFRFESGPIADPYSAEGTAFFDLGKEPRFSVEATGQQFNVEDDQNGVAGGMSLGERIAEVEDTLALVPEPTIPGSVNIKLPAVVAGQTTIRDLALSARPENRGWRILSASMQLPGRSTLEADGYLSGGDAPKFDGNLLLAVKQPTGFAAWLSRDIEDAVRALPAAGFKAAVNIDGVRQTFSDMELILGPTKLTGAVERTSLPTAKPVIVARLAGGTIDAETATAFAALLGEGTVREHDLDVTVKAGKLAVAGVEIGALDAAARLSGEQFDLDRLSIGDLAGASVAATGAVRGLSTQPEGDIDLTVTAADLAPLADQVARWLPDSLLASELARRGDMNPGLLNDVRVDIIGSGSAQAPGWPTQLNLSIGGNLGEAALQGSIVRSSAAGVPEALKADLEIANDDATRLLALAGLPTLPVVSLGAGKLSATIELQDGQNYATTAAIDGPDFRVSFDGSTTAADQSLAANGKLLLKAQDIEPWLLAVGAPLPGMGFGTSAELQADADFSKDLLVLNGLSGTTGESAVSGDVNMDFSKSRPGLSGALALDTLDLEPLAATLLGGSALASPDGLAWPSAEFASKATAPVGADLDLTVGTLAAGILPTVHDASLSLRLSDNQLVLSNLTGQSAGGALTGNVDLSNEAGNSLVSAQLSLKDADLALLLANTGVSAPAVKGNSDISVSFASAGKSVEAIVAGLSGSGVVNLKGIDVAGLNATALPELISRADALGQGIDDAATTRFAPDLIKAGDFAAGDSSFAFNIASGVVRASATTFDRERAALTAEGRIDLNSQAVDATASFALKPGDDALVGAEPTVRFDVTGPVSAPQVALDTSGLAQFLTQRQLEIEQARVEAMQAAIMEKQRLRREAARYTALYAHRAEINATEMLRKATLVRLHAEAEERRLKLEAEEKAKAEAAKAAEEAQQPAAEPEEPKPQSSAPRRPQQQPASAIGNFPPPPTGDVAPDFSDPDFDG